MMGYVGGFKDQYSLDLCIIINTNDDPYFKLASGIIFYAIVDYRKAVRYLKEHPDYYGTSLNNKHRCNLKDCEKFFNSEWFCQLCDDNIDGTKLAELIRRQEGWDGIYES